MKQKAYEKLQNNLEEMTKQYRLLLDCVRKEKEFLLQTKIAELDANNILKEQLLADINATDSLRVTYASELAKILNIDYVEPRLLEIAKHLGGDEGDRLRGIHSTLELITKRLIDLNNDNATYAESALFTVNSAMNNVKESLMGQKTYQKKGKYQQGSDTSGHLVSKEA
jgi:flagellar biosynthesis/type III secretory pathway chaperone